MVIHNDELAYYEVVAYMQRYIDYCIVISSKIKSELIEYGFNTKKIVVINWNIPVDEKERSVNYSIIVSEKNAVVNRIKIHGCVFFMIMVWFAKRVFYCLR